MNEQPFDEIVKKRYREFLESWQLKHVEAQLVVFFKERSIDLIAECSESDLARLQGTIFEHFRPLNTIEFKGGQDRLHELDFSKIMARGWAAGVVKSQEERDGPGDKKIKVGDDQYLLPTHHAITIISVVKPVKLLYWLKDIYQFEPTEEKGVYLASCYGIPVWLIHPSSLEIKPRNYPLLPLAKGKKLAAFIELCLEKGMLGYLQLIVDIGHVVDSDTIMPKILEIMNMRTKMRRETWEYIDESLRNMPEFKQELSVFRDAISHSQQASMLQTQRQMLILQLQHKFAGLPKSVVQKIQDTSDTEQLNRWAVQLLSAESLADMELLEVA